MRPKSNIQQRLFRSNESLRRPPAATAAEVVQARVTEEVSPQWPSAAKTPASQWGNGWARSTRTSGLTEAEKALRAALTAKEKPQSSQKNHDKQSAAQKTKLGFRGNQSNAVPRSSETSNATMKKPRPLKKRHVGLDSRNNFNKSEDDDRFPTPAKTLDERSLAQAESTKNNGIYRPNWVCLNCGSTNHSNSRSNNGDCRSCGHAQPQAQFWQCQECKGKNPLFRRRCEHCWFSAQQGSRLPKHDVQGPRLPEHNVSQHWKHVQLSRTSRNAHPNRDVAANSPPPLQNQEFDRQAREAEAQRRLRMEKTKSGEFVGFGATSKHSSLASWGASVDGDEEKAIATLPSSDENNTIKSQMNRTRPDQSSAPYNRGLSRQTLRKRPEYAVRDEDIEEDDDQRAAARRERNQQRKKEKATRKKAAPPTPIYLPEFISVSNLAGVLRVRVEDFSLKMQGLGFEELSNDHVLDAETAGLIAAEFNFEPTVDRSDSLDLQPRPPAEDKSILQPRPPVVTIMGHVDHGKTTLLDYLRKSSVAASEHGGITQHIGAFSVPMPGGRLVTFLDTPGHEAFLSMRKRGANVTDIVILVVAADDSVMPQTIEAIKHAQAAKVPMIVAVNKVDKEDSNVDRVKQDLARYGVEIEDFEGDTQVVCVSGKTGQGMGELEDATVALADIIDMRSETDGQAEGWVLEATTKKAGRVATVLVRRGTLKPGDVIVAGTSWARVRGLRNEAGVMIPRAGPGTPVEVDGWREQPSAGDEILQAPDEQKAKSVVAHRVEVSQRVQMSADMAAVNEARRIEQEKRAQLEKAAELAAAATATEDDSSAPAPDAASAANVATSTPSFQEVFFIIKADVSGSAEAVTDQVSALGTSEIRPHILRSGVGPITEFDVDHAAVANGHIISFNTVIEGAIARMAEEKGVQIIDQSIIYRLVDDVKAKLSEKLPPLVTQRVSGEAEIAQIFDINVKGRVKVPVAGCRVRNGVVGRGEKVRVLRGKEVVYDGMFFLRRVAMYVSWVWRR